MRDRRYGCVMIFLRILVQTKGPSSIRILARSRSARSPTSNSLSTGKPDSFKILRQASTVSGKNPIPKTFSISFFTLAAISTSSCFKQISWSKNREECLETPLRTCNFFLRGKCVRDASVMVQSNFFSSPIPPSKRNISTFFVFTRFSNLFSFIAAAASPKRFSSISVTSTLQA